MSIHKAEENFNQIWPLSFGELYSGNSSDDLRCKVTSLLLCGAESDKGILFDLGLGISAERKPPMSKLRLPCAFLEIDRQVREKNVLKGKGGRLTRADRAFFKARPAAFRTWRGVLSFTRTDESISMYSGYIDRRRVSSVERRCRACAHSCPERLSRVFG